jgi:hypothetical protein
MNECIASLIFNKCYVNCQSIFFLCELYFDAGKLIICDGMNCYFSKEFMIE